MSPYARQYSSDGQGTHFPEWCLRVYRQVVGLPGLGSAAIVGTSEAQMGVARAGHGIMPIKKRPPLSPHTTKPQAKMPGVDAEGGI